MTGQKGMLVKQIHLHFFKIWDTEHVSTYHTAPNASTRAIEPVQSLRRSCRRTPPGCSISLRNCRTCCSLSVRRPEPTTSTLPPADACWNTGMEKATPHSNWSHRLFPSPFSGNFMISNTNWFINTHIHENLMEPSIHWPKTTQKGQGRRQEFAHPTNDPAQCCLSCMWAVTYPAINIKYWIDQWLYILFYYISIWYFGIHVKQ